MKTLLEFPHQTLQFTWCAPDQSHAVFTNRNVKSRPPYIDFVFSGIKHIRTFGATGLLELHVPDDHESSEYLRSVNIAVSDSSVWILNLEERQFVVSDSLTVYSNEVKWSYIPVIALGQYIFAAESEILFSSVATRNQHVPRNSSGRLYSVPELFAGMPVEILQSPDTLADVFTEALARQDARLLRIALDAAFTFGTPSNIEVDIGLCLGKDWHRYDRDLLRLLGDAPGSAAGEAIHTYALHFIGSRERDSDGQLAVLCISLLLGRGGEARQLARSLANVFPEKIDHFVSDELV
jgi:hypothetical protein